ncbi:MAG: hypothetical protein OXF76_16935 [Caldilineaceae bacterium]|nr:hypothetical protein [Caldilineaceae bacterium]
MTGWKLTRRGDYINGDLASRTLAAVVALERSGLWSYVVRDRATGEDQGRGANYPTDQGAMDAAEAEAAPVEPHRAPAAQVIDFMQAKQRGEYGSGG